MHARRLAIGLFALAALALAPNLATAGDTIRLSLPGDTTAPTLNLKATADDLAADTVPTHLARRAVGFVAHRGYYGGYRGYYGGYRGYYGGYRGYYGGYYGPRFSAYYGPRFYRPYYGGYYASSYYYPSYSDYVYPSPVYYAPIGLSASVVVQRRLNVLRSATLGYESPAPLPMPLADEQPSLVPTQPGTYPYDGGPQRQIPMPPAEESSVSYPRLSKPAVVEDLVIKLPGKSGKWTYPAYGEKPSR